jgi:CheY-like chemotaxis protein
VGDPLVLIVDNEEGLLLLFGRLVEHLGYDIIKADSGQMAIDILKEQTPDLLILDLAMPTVSGFDVLRFIMTEPRLDKMPVMVLTATGPGPAPSDVDRRIDRWVTKPVMPSDFSEQVRSLLET